MGIFEAANVLDGGGRKGHAESQKQEVKGRVHANAKTDSVLYHLTMTMARERNGRCRGFYMGKRNADQCSGAAAIPGGMVP